MKEIQTNMKKEIESTMKKYIWLTVIISLVIGGTSWFMSKTAVAKAKLTEAVS